jgi:hypothetical protein
MKVNFAAKKHDLGIALMNQLSNSEKQFPKDHPDIAADFFALRKSHTGTRWIFTEGRNSLNMDSHCDIAWAAALASHAHTERKSSVSASLLLENGMILHSDGRLVPCPPPREYPTDPQNASTGSGSSSEAQLLASEDPRIWRRWA